MQIIQFRWANVCLIYLLINTRPDIKNSAFCISNNDQMLIQYRSVYATMERLVCAFCDRQKFRFQRII